MSEKEALNMDAGSPPPAYQQAYPPQQGGYPPQQGQYPPQQGGQYQPVPQGPPQGQYPPGQYPPQQQGYAPQPGYTQQVVVTQPGQAPMVVGQPRPPDYLLLSVLACLCCFWPTGLCAIYYACRTNTLAGEGDMMEAQRTSNSARNLIIVSVVVGIICIALILILKFVVYTTTVVSAGSYYDK